MHCLTCDGVGGWHRDICWPYDDREWRDCPDCEGTGSGDALARFAARLACARLGAALQGAVLCAVIGSAGYDDALDALVYGDDG